MKLARSSSRSWIQTPWTHFLLIGTLAYAVLVFLSGSEGVENVTLDATDEARIERQWKLLGEGAERYASKAVMRDQALTEKVLYLEALKLNFHRQDPAIRQRLLATLEILDLEDLPAGSDVDPLETAIEMGLHLGDEVVRQRMVLMMQVALEAMSSPEAVTDDDVIGAYQAHRKRWIAPATVSFSHAFLGEAETVTEGAANTEKIVLEEDWSSLNLEQGLAISKPFLSGYRFTELDVTGVAKVFGENFAQTLAENELPLDVWHLPIRSAFGWHAVWVDAYVAERPLPLIEVKERIRQELEAVARAEARVVAVNRLRASYGLDPIAAT